ncbi:hypothetical protein FDB61_15855 [Clostridium botulinum]|nr:hypothetical protein [Clostridium botulinum]
MILFFPGFHRISQCNVDVFGRVVIATQDLEELPGTSITNAAEEVAKAACREFKIPCEELIFIEHYKEEHYKIVDFTVKNGEFFNPDWRTITLEEASKIINANCDINKIDKFIYEEKKLIEKTYNDRLKFFHSICSHRHTFNKSIDKKNHCCACDLIVD